MLGPKAGEDMRIIIIIISKLCKHKIGYMRFEDNTRYCLGQYFRGRGHKCKCDYLICHHISDQVILYINMF